MPGKKHGPRQLRLADVGKLDSGVENLEDEDIADASWESIVEDIARMAVRLGFRLTPVPESGEDTDELAA